MLSLVTAKSLRPEIEALDRDPGILSLISTFARFTGDRADALVRSVRTAHQRAIEAEVFSSATAWPYNHKM